MWFGKLALIESAAPVFGAMEVAVHIPDACDGMGRIKRQLLTVIEMYMHVPKTRDGKSAGAAYYLDAFRRGNLASGDHDSFASDEDGMFIDARII
jgi:hypothetical protein